MGVYIDQHGFLLFVIGQQAERSPLGTFGTNKNIDIYFIFVHLSILRIAT